MSKEGILRVKENLNNMRNLNFNINKKEYIDDYIRGYLDALFSGADLTVNELMGFTDEIKNAIRGSKIRTPTSKIDILKGRTGNEKANANRRTNFKIL